MASPSFIAIIFLFFFPILFLQLAKSMQENVCRKWCGDIPIQYPLGIDDGCGSPYYRHIITCTAGELQLRTPSGSCLEHGKLFYGLGFTLQDGLRYPIKNVSYSDPHILVTDPFMWSCDDGEDFRPTRPFSLDTSTHFTLSPQNDYLFFNCSADKVIVEPKPAFCERFPEQCDSTCDSASFLCRHLPECPSALRGGGSSCCAYYPKAAESMRLMLRHCASYTAVYWRNLGATPAFNQVPEYGVRVDFDIPVTAKCLECQDFTKGGGTCGFDTETQDFLCLCDKGNSTTNCLDTRHKMSKVVAATAVSVAGAIGLGAGVWYLRRVRAKAPVTHGVQTNDNRLF